MGTRLLSYLCLSAMVGLLCSTKTRADDQHPSIVQPITVSEFMQLDDRIQSIYVGGIIEGMAFTAYGNQWPDYLNGWPAFAAKASEIQPNKSSRLLKRTQASTKSSRVPWHRRSVSGANTD
jgi:hypothetical protein